MSKGIIQHWDVKVSFEFDMPSDRKPTKKQVMLQLLEEVHCPELAVNIFEVESVTKGEEYEKE